MAFNIVEALASGEGDDCAFDQRCKFGHRVEGHAVYCHNDAWTDGPRKCRRSWYTGGEIRDEDCPGFQPNESFKGEIATPVLAGYPCTVCGGTKLVRGDKQTVETCDTCRGTGEKPTPLTLSEVEVFVLESCIGASFSHPFDHETAILSGDAFRVKMFPSRLIDEGLLSMRSVGWDGPATVHMVRLTRKGYANLRDHWDKGKNAKNES